MTLVLTSVSPMTDTHNGNGPDGRGGDDLRGARGVLFASALCLGFWGVLLTAVIG